MSQYDGRVRADPLTRCNSAGALLRREPGVEAQIEAALQLEEAELIAWARRPGGPGDGALQEEALVYLVRHFGRRGRFDLMDRLVEILVDRCSGYIAGKARGLARENLDDCFQDIVVALLDHVCDLRTDRGDYLEVRFWLYLRRLCADVMRRYYRERKRAAWSVPLDAPPGGGDGEAGELPLLDRLAAYTAGPEEVLLLHDALAALDEPLRTVFLLRHYVDLPVEDSNPGVPTISGYFEKTPRTIRNWFREIDKTLREWQGEEQWAR